MKVNDKAWKKMWVFAALFNFAIGIPIVLLTTWSYSLAFGISGNAIDPMAIRLWRDFGFLVIIIGIGYYLVARDINKNGGIVWLGIIAKAFDVITLTYRYLVDIANEIVLIPAAIDALFMLLFHSFHFTFSAPLMKIAL